MGPYCYLQGTMMLFPKIMVDGLRGYENFQDGISGLIIFYTNLSHKKWGLAVLYST
jgi:hypothetical protein